MKSCKQTLGRLFLLLAVTVLLTLGVSAAQRQAADADEFYAAMEAEIRAQSTEFSIDYTGDRSELNSTNGVLLAELLRYLMARSDDSPQNGDYPALNIEEGVVHWNDTVCSFQLAYLDTQEELDYVDQQAQAIVDSLDLEGEDDYTKIKLIYEYICTHFVYDHSLTKYSAYDGLTTGSMVCQGYALLTYRAMWDAGIPCRIVTGRSENQNHAWNIVLLDGQWYYLDTTWDSAVEEGGPMSWNFFLKGEEDFDGHIRFQAFTTDEYVAAHPMAAVSAPLPRIQVLVNGGSVTNLAVRVGVEIQLEAVLADGSQAEIVWSSSDPPMVTVTPDGQVLAHGTGELELTAAVVGDRGVISAVVPTTSVDLTAAAPWAQSAVNDYYLAQLLPLSLCSGFENDLTRAELARLCWQLVQQSGLWKAQELANPFSDILDSPDAAAILACNSLGLMQGTSATTFQPDAPVTREQAAVVLFRLMVLLDGKAPATGPLSYLDATAISDWAAGPVSGVTGAKVFYGSDGFFSPADNVTLQEMIVALWRIAQPHMETAAAAA